MTYCTLVFVIAWGSYLFYALLLSRGVHPALHYQVVTQFSPAIAAILLMILTEGMPGIRKLTRSLFNWRIGWGWLLLATFFEPIMFFVFTLGYWAMVSGFPEWNAVQWGSNAISVAATFVIGLLRWGFAEEVGWRGWLLPKLQQRMSAYKASLFLALIVTLWHYNPGSFIDAFRIKEGVYLLGSYPDILERLIITVPITLLMTVIYNHTGGSLLAMMLFHSSSNSSYFWLKETFGIVGTDFFKASFLVTMLAMAVILSYFMIQRRI